MISELQTELAKAEEALGVKRVTNKKNVTTSTLSLAAKHESILAVLGERQAELKPLPGIERELKELELGEKVTLAAYESVEKEFQEAEIKNSFAAREVQLVAEAVPPHLPSGPPHLIIALVSLVSGMMGAIGLVAVLEFLDRSIRGVRDVEDLIGVKALATIPYNSQMSTLTGQLQALELCQGIDSRGMADADSILRHPPYEC